MVQQWVWNVGCSSWVELLIVGNICEVECGPIQQWWGRSRDYAHIPFNLLFCNSVRFRFGNVCVRVPVLLLRRRRAACPSPAPRPSSDVCDSEQHMRAYIPRPWLVTRRTRGDTSRLLQPPPGRIRHVRRYVLLLTTFRTISTITANIPDYNTKTTQWYQS